MKRHKKNRVIVGAVSLLIVGGLAAYLGFLREKNPAPTGISGNAVKNEPTDYKDVATPTANSSSAPSSSLHQTPPPVSNLSKPTLQKSSGNAPGSSVPSGSGIEFTCEGTLGASCQIILTSKTNPSNAIALPAKPISSNGRGANFANWTWSAVQGSWSVVAKTSDGTGTTTTSDAQSLEIK